MKIKHNYSKLLGLIVLSIFNIQFSICTAQTVISRMDEILDAPMPKAGQYMDSVLSPKSKQWISENGLDSIDQNKIPKIVTMGLMANANMNHFLITRRVDGKWQTSSTYLQAGVEVGGFMDFLVGRHFAIQGRLIFTAEQNHFGIQDSTNHLWAFGMDLPVLFMYRLGNLEKGYFNAGAGIFAHFTFAGNKKIYHNTETEVVPSEAPPFYVSLHDNHAGVIAHAGYEFPIGIQINFNYMVSLSDIFGYYKVNDRMLSDRAFYPERFALGIGYRWK